MNTLPVPLQLLWLNDQPASTRATLGDALTTSPVTEMAYFLEVLSVYSGEAVGAKRGLESLVTLRADRINAVYSIAVMSAAGVRFVPAASRAAAVVYAVARTCTYSNYGDRYVAAMLATTVPMWRTVAVPCGVPAYAAVAEEFPATANDRVRPLLEVAVKTVISAADLTRAAPADTRAVLATIATIQELCNGFPAVHVNCGLAAASADVPSIAVFIDESGGDDVFSWTGIYIAYRGKFLQPQSTATATGVIVNWLVACRAEAASVPTTVADLIGYVLDGTPCALSARLK